MNKHQRPLGRLASELMASAAPVLEAFDRAIGPEAQAGIAKAVKGGSSAGLELIVDPHGRPTVAFVVIEPEGARHVVAHIAVGDGPHSPQ